MDKNVLLFIKQNSNLIRNSQPSDVTFWSDKTGNLFYVVHKKSENTRVEYNKFKAYYLQQINGELYDKEIGFLDYTILDKPGNIWINNIKVDATVLGMGVGHSLLVTFEQFAYTHYYRNVSGKFYPTEPAPNGQMVKEFYEKHGYYIDNYDWFLDKTLDHSNYLKNCNDAKLVENDEVLQQNNGMQMQRK